MEKSKNDGLYRDIPKISGFLTYGAATIFLLGPLLALFLIVTQHYTPSLDALMWWAIMVLTPAGIAFLMHRGEAKVGGRILGGIILFIVVMVVASLYY